MRSLSASKFAILISLRTPDLDNVYRQMIVFSALMWWAYSYKEYKRKPGQLPTRIGQPLWDRCVILLHQLCFDTFFTWFPSINYCRSFAHFIYFTKLMVYDVQQRISPGKPLRR